MKKYREYHVQRLLKKWMRDDLIDFYLDSQYNEYDVVGANSLGVRQDYVDLDDYEWRGLYDSVRNAIHTSNYKAGWNFNLTDFHQPLRISKYTYGYYHDWHLDYVSTDQSKIAMSCLLDDQFSGGEFQMLEVETPKLKPGQAITFPAYHGHRVTKVKSGERYVLLAWYTGPRFA